MWVGVVGEGQAVLCISIGQKATSCIENHDFLYICKSLFGVYLHRTTDLHFLYMSIARLLFCLYVSLHGLKKAGGGAGLRDPQP